MKFRNFRITEIKVECCECCVQLGKFLGCVKFQSFSCAMMAEMIDKTGRVVCAATLIISSYRFYGSIPGPDDITLFRYL